MILKSTIENFADFEPGDSYKKDSYKKNGVVHAYSFK